MDVCQVAVEKQQHRKVISKQKQKEQFVRVAFKWFAGF
jgi:hypothetical protein